jgi:hypothetical protein
LAQAINSSTPAAASSIPSTGRLAAVWLACSGTTAMPCCSRAGSAWARRIPASAAAGVAPGRKRAIGVNQTALEASGDRFKSHGFDMGSQIRVPRGRLQDAGAMPTTR